MSKPNETFVVTLRPLPNWNAPPVIRMRRALKMLLRQYGLKCTCLAEQKPEPAVSKPSETVAAGATTESGVTHSGPAEAG